MTLSTRLAPISFKLSIPLVVHVAQESLPTFARFRPSKRRRAWRSGASHLAVWRRNGEMLWRLISESGGRGSAVGVGWRGLGRPLGGGVFVVVAAVVAPWLGYCVPEAQQQA